MNIGIATGMKSGLTILDIDIGKKGGDITWAELTKNEGEPETLMSRTGSGGIHIFFQYNSVLKTSTNTLGPGVDCRNDGGYIVAPPSAHRSGSFYEWLNENEIQPLPAYLTQKKQERRDKKRKKNQYTLAEVKEMLAVVPADDRDVWRKVGIILGREFNKEEEAWDLYNSWSDKWGGQKGRNHDEIMKEAFYELSQQDGELSLGTILRYALDNGWSPKTGSLPVENFLYYAPGNNFIYRPTQEFWIAAALDASVSAVNEGGELIKASEFVKKSNLITSMTNDPIIPTEVKKEYDCLQGIVVPSKGGALFNSYRPPIVEIGDPEKVGRWLDHVNKVFYRPGDADQFLDYMAHRVQKPGEKPRFSLVLIGEQGTGKDTAIQMCAASIGEWNIANIEAKEVESSFNEFISKTLIVVSEVSNSEDMSKFTFNERMKVLIAGTPDYMMVNPKYGVKYFVRLHNGVIITTNHINGLYIPADDRRYDVIHGASRSEMGIETDEQRAEYFREFWSWFYQTNAASNIAGFLRARDISHFDPNTGQRKTEAHSMIVASGFDSDSWLLEAVRRLGEPAVLNFEQIWTAIESDPHNKIERREAHSRVGYVMNRIGFSRLVNRSTADGRWKVGDLGYVTIFYDPKKIDTAGAEGYVKQGKLAGKAF